MDAAKILVVEDERIIALDLVQRLRRLGFAVDGFATRADVALERALAERPDLVLMDIHLDGGGDGIEAARALYEQTRIPVVFLTAYADAETLERAEAALPFGYLLKPCQNAELNAAIRMAMARREAEARLERSEERQRLALDAACLGVWEWQAGSEALSVGGHFDSILGAPSERHIETRNAFLERVHPADRETVRAALARAQDENGALDTTFRVIRSDESEGWIEAYARAFAPTAASPARVIGVLKDVTERHRLEHQLRQAAAVFDATAEGIFIADEDFRIISVNPAFTTLTGYPADEAIGRDAEVLLHARRRDGSSALSADPGSWQGETHFQRKSGEIFPVWESLTVVQPNGGGDRHTIVVFADIAALQQAEAELHHLAHFDPLTGLPNRLLFNDRLTQALERARRGGTRCALLFLDLDNFKTINDTLGHSSGDLLLQTVTARMRELLRRVDTMARLGGDEFVILLDGIERPEDGARIAKKQLDVLAQPVDLGGERVSISASIGMSLFPDDGLDAATLIKAADTAMYQAKAQGRNRFCFHTPEMAAQAAERMNLEQGLRRALPGGELLLHFQPQVSLVDGRLTGVEALARWPRPDSAPISPERFIPIAEDTGLIDPLGRWVLEEACRQGAEWRRLGWTGRLAVNVSGRQLANEQFAETVGAALAASGFPASALELEITESSLLAIERNRSALSRLKQLGLQIAIDDFGTGYSSLSVLKHLPIDRLKIDRSFVKDLPGSADDTAIVDAICALARTLGLSLVAEGVETPEQRDLLRQLGCEEGQGYWFSRPLPGNAIATLLQAPPPWRFAGGSPP